MTEFGYVLDLSGRWAWSEWAMEPKNEIFDRAMTVSRAKVWLVSGQLERDSLVAVGRARSHAFGLDELPA